MIGKLFFVLALFICEGTCVTEIRLPDRNVTYIRNELFGTTIGIPKLFLDTLNSCDIIFPNGALYMVYPESNIPFPNVYRLEITKPFQNCAVGFRNVGTDFSGTYELISTVLHHEDNSVSVTRQRFNLVVEEIDF